MSDVPRDRSETDPSEESPGATSAEGPARAAAPEEELSPRDALKKGFGLLWQAARTAADEIKREVDTAGVKDSLREAGRELEAAAHEAKKALETFIERGPKEPKPDYSDSWPPPDGGARAQRADADIPEDGGTDESGERRDMRILVDDD